MNKKLKEGVFIAAALVTILGGYKLFGNHPSSSFNASTTGDNSSVLQANVAGDFHYQNARDPNYLNNRNDDLRNMTPEEVVESYFELQNTLRFREACSLLEKQDCDAQDGESIEEFSKGRSSYVNGFENVIIWTPDKQPEYEQVVCAKYSYLLKADANPKTVTEIMSFYLSNREDNEWEITTRACEKKHKEDRGQEVAHISPLLNIV